jgi:hypothetical protein
MGTPRIHRTAGLLRFFAPRKGASRSAYPRDAPRGFWPQTPPVKRLRDQASLTPSNNTNDHILIHCLLLASLVL